VISAGNDIVALKAVDLQRTELPAFYSKFITEAELALHEHSALPFSTFIWLLWSVKESAHKYFKRLDNGLVFSPIKIVVEQLTQTNSFDDSKLRCDVAIESYYTIISSFDETTLYFKSVINNDFIATTVAIGNVYWGVKRIDNSNYKTQSAAVRLFALDTLSNTVVGDDLWFDKHPWGGYPMLMHGHSLVDIPISFAHHDRYVSYAFQISK
jgi:phosphopantetheinyl transferase (holo-ACP synthase)